MVITNFLVNFIITTRGFFVMTLDNAIESLKHGEFVLLYDSAGRESNSCIGLIVINRN